MRAFGPYQTSGADIGEETKKSLQSTSPYTVTASSAPLTSSVQNLGPLYPFGFPDPSKPD